MRPATRVAVVPKNCTKKGGIVGGAGAAGGAPLRSPNAWVAWETCSRDSRAGASLCPAASKLPGSWFSHARTGFTDANPPTTSAPRSPRLTMAAPTTVETPRRSRPRTSGRSRALSSSARATGTKNVRPT